MTHAPLGPIRAREIWRRVPGNPSHHEGKEYMGTYYLDATGNEYNSIEHLLRCAIAKELGL